MVLLTVVEGSSVSLICSELQSKLLRVHVRIPREFIDCIISLDYMHKYFVTYIQNTKPFCV